MKRDKPDNFEIDENKKTFEQSKKTKQSGRDSGIIKRIELENFMCHAHLTVDLLSNVNVIHGANGSGKSAILVALQAALGSRAKDCGRGTTIKDLVRTGCSAATITVTISNKGKDAFNPNKYGDSIKIKRHFTKSGCSSYSICNSNGKLVSTKRLELDHILEKFNIQVNNPLMLMNQDNSRQFLHQSSPEQTYILFLVATQLATIKKNIQEVFDIKDKIEALNEEKKQLLPTLESRFIEAEQNYCDSEEIRNLEPKILQTQAAILWAAVSEDEIERDEATRKSSRFAEEINNLQRDQDKLKSEIDLLLQSNDEINEKMKYKMKEIESFTEELHEIYSQLKSFNKQKSVLSTKKDEFYRQIELKQNKISEIERERSFAESEVKKNFQSEKEQLEAEIKTLFTTLNEKRKEKERILSSKKDEVKQKFELNSEISSKKGEMPRIEAEIHEINSRLDRLEAAKNNRNRIFVRQAPEIDEMILRNKSKFSHPPIGPIGNYIMLREEHWAGPVEALLKPILSSYIVDSSADYLLLKEIFSQCRVDSSQATIYTMKYSPYRYENVFHFKDKVPFKSVYDTIMIKDEAKDNANWIHRVVVASSNPEHWLLGNDQQETMEYLQANLGNLDELRGFYYPGGRIVSRQRMLTNYNTGIKPTHLTGSLDEDILGNKQRLMKLEKDLSFLNEEKKKLENVFFDIIKNLEGRDNTLEKIASEIWKLENRINKYERRITTISNDQTNLIQQNYEEEINNLQKEILIFQEQQNELFPQEESLLKELNLLTSKRKEKEEKIKEKKEDSDIVENNAKKIVAEVTVRNHEISSSNQKKSALSERKSFVDQRITQLDQLITEKSKQASKVSSSRTHLKTDNISSFQLMEELKNLQARFESEKNNFRVDYSTACNQYYVAKTHLKNTVNHLNRAESDVKKLEKSIQLRLQKWKEFVKKMGEQTKLHFINYMNDRGHFGSLEIDHEEKVMRFKLAPDGSESISNNTTSDPKSMSGGERSYTTLAFVLALGEAIYAPLLAIDEFDIFMDSINRRVALQKLCKVAKNHRDRQFIFITPHDVSMLHDPDVKILKLTPPERDQGILDFDN